MSLADLFAPPAPIDGRFVQRVIFDTSPMPEGRKLNPQRAYRRPGDLARHEAKRAFMRKLSEAI